MVIKIERKTLPHKYIKGTISHDFFTAMGKMRVGDSFVVNKQYYTTFWFVKDDYEFRDKHFVTRKEDLKNIRIYRIK